MRFEDVYVPYGGYWCTPFCKWQGSFSTLHPIRFAADTAKRAIKERGMPLDVIDGLSLGLTIPCRHAFYGTPWLAGLMGLTGVTGPMISQACATSVRSLAYGANELATGNASVFLAITADKTSNGPHLYYPDGAGPGGTGEAENWVLDNFNHDPFAKNSMIQTAENVAADAGIGRDEQEQLVLLRHAQYQNSQKDERAFARRYMVAPIEVKDPRGRKTLATVVSDEGVFPSTADGLAKLAPVIEGGTITFGSQTYPADGNAGMLLADADRSRELSRDKSVEIQLLSFAQARVRKGMMPMANVPAVRKALAGAGIEVSDVSAITTHVPFAVNDIYLFRELGIKVEDMNRFGSSLVWGHAQAPTGLRSIIELIEELALAGGGYGLFTGCAAGDSAGALVLKVTVS